mmetsp:Transcript_41707/g.105140  ORF Transcript_41707/g.105140 Transcript_41707/m.105140 type:complete len:219 (-) Transcript_41707:668-1324(-)
MNCIVVRYAASRSKEVWRFCSRRKRRCCSIAPPARPLRVPSLQHIHRCFRQPPISLRQPPCPCSRQTSPSTLQNHRSVRWTRARARPTRTAAGQPLPCWAPLLRPRLAASTANRCSRSARPICKTTSPLTPIRRWCKSRRCSQSSTASRRRRSMTSVSPSWECPSWAYESAFYVLYETRAHRSAMAAVHRARMNSLEPARGQPRPATCRGPRPAIRRH